MLKINEHWQINHPVFEYQKDYNDADTDWVGHNFFAYDLVVNLSPKLIVQVGVEDQYSLYTFAQAIKDTGQDCKAVDVIGKNTKGKHMTVPARKKIFKESYSKVAVRLVEMDNIRAAKRFEESSVNILLIAPQDSYETVKELFDTWKSKLSKDGIILLLGVHKDSPAMRRLWEVVQTSKSQTVLFPQSTGLGLVSFSPTIKKTFTESTTTNLVNYYTEISAMAQSHLTLQKEQAERVNYLELNNHRLQAQLQDITRRK